MTTPTHTGSDRMLFLDLPVPDAGNRRGARRGRQPGRGAAGDMGSMCGRSLLDPDGHHWEVIWRSPAAVEAGPPVDADQRVGADA